ncbi:hypothetical protein WICPIJ_002598 [Wickerhamomyces pijperi]|uniref:Uncharacterized protein n=1 Tax=Wickerhamomyces pijperi TaxID=599730 RepID=A0A9P8TPP2_WICPI|nr:hypothetical protein WICPIJ_002598 [Wickerhamomyces pijperi]
MRPEGNTGIWNHPHDGGNKPSVKIGQVGDRFGQRSLQEPNDMDFLRDSWRFSVDFSHGGDQSSLFEVVVMVMMLNWDNLGVEFPRLIRQSHTDQVQRIRDEHRAQPSHTPTEQSPYRCLVVLVRYKNVSDLFIRHKLDRRIGKDPQQSGRVTLVEPSEAVCEVYSMRGTEKTKQGPRVLRIYWVRRLEKDLDSVEWGNQCFGR